MGEATEAGMLVRSNVCGGRHRSIRWGGEGRGLTQACAGSAVLLDTNDQHINIRQILESSKLENIHAFVITRVIQYAIYNEVLHSIHTVCTIYYTTQA